MANFKSAMAKLAVVGQNVDELIDCSDVIPAAKPFTGKAVFPPSLTNKDVEQGVCVLFSTVGLKNHFC